MFKIKGLIFALVLFFGSVAFVSGQVLLSDDFFGTTIDLSKWSVYDNGYGGALLQNEELIWSKEGTTGRAGFGIRTVNTFQNGGIYVIEGDYSIIPDDVPLEDKSIGESGTGWHITSLEEVRATNENGRPLNTILIYFKGGVLYVDRDGNHIGFPEMVQRIWYPELGLYRHLFSYFGSAYLHLKLVLDTDNLTIQCYGNDDPIPWTEGRFTQEIWDNILNGTDQFTFEEYRNWAFPIDDYFESKLDNWSIRRIIDENPPEISVTVNPEMLWPPNHKMKDIVTTVEVIDDSDPNPRIELYSVESNEPDDSPDDGDGETVNDIQGIDVGNEDYNFSLRAERSGNGECRIYTIIYSATDASGKIGYDTTKVIVPLSMGKYVNQYFDKDGHLSNKAFELSPNTPNPFNPRTTINYVLLKPGFVELTVFNMRGQEIVTLINDYQSTGKYSVDWNSTNEFGLPVPSGLYFYRIKTGNHIEVRKMTLLK